MVTYSMLIEYVFLNSCMWVMTMTLNAIHYSHCVNNYNVCTILLCCLIGTIETTILETGSYIPKFPDRIVIGDDYHSTVDRRRLHKEDVNHSGKRVKENARLKEKHFRYWRYLMQKSIATNRKL